MATAVVGTIGTQAKPQMPVMDPYAATGVPVTPKPPVTPPSINVQPQTGGPTPYTPPGLQNSTPGSGGNTATNTAPPVTGGLTPVGNVSAPAPAPAGPPPVAQNPATGVGMQGFGPGNTLIGQQVTPQGQPDRMQIAKDYFSQMAEAGAPAYEAALRSATQREAANGGLGSGQLNTTYGNLALNRARDLDLLQRGLTTQATEGTIGDQRVNRAEYRTERDYQNALQNQALQQRLQQLAMEQGIGQSQAGYLGSYNANPNLVASTSYGNTANTQSTGLQEMLKAIYSQLPDAASNIPNVPIDQIVNSSDILRGIIG